MITGMRRRGVYDGQNARDRERLLGFLSEDLGTGINFPTQSDSDDAGGVVGQARMVRSPREISIAKSQTK